MRAELLQLASDLARHEEPFVLAVVVRRQPASSAQAGDMALITAAGAFHGWLGGSCTQPAVTREARRALAEGAPRFLILSPDAPRAARAEGAAGAGGSFSPAAVSAGAGPEAGPRPGVTVLPMTCHSGGSVEIYLEPILPALRLLVLGVSPTAQALARLGKGMGYTVTALDPAAELALFPAADRVLQRIEDLPPPAPGVSAGFAVVATMGERDEEAILEALSLAPSYLGVVASARRFAQLREGLLARGVAAEKLDAIRSPAGLAIGAHTPEEIALSVLAEIVARRRKPAGGEAAEAGPMTGRGAGGGTGQAPATTSAHVAPPVALPVPGLAPSSPGDSAEATDPVCGMVVEVATARHTARSGGRTWYFCCGGCRERFLADPGRYLPQGGQAAPAEREEQAGRAETEAAGRIG